MSRATWLTEFDKLPLFSSGLARSRTSSTTSASARAHAPERLLRLAVGEADVAGLAKFTFLR